MPTENVIDAIVHTISNGNPEVANKIAEFIDTFQRSAMSVNSTPPELAKFGIESDENGPRIEYAYEEFSNSWSDSKGGRFVEGYMCTQMRTRRGERCRNYCFNDSIALFMKNPQMLFNHKMDRPIGQVVDIRQDDAGTWVQCKILDDEIWNMIQDGRLRMFSWMGYIRDYVIENDPDPKFADKEVLWINRADLLECSVVSIGNVPNALFEVMNKAEDGSADISMWLPFSQNSVSEDERMVFGYATLFGVKDTDGHRMTRQAVEKALPGYAEFRNVREMHQAKAIGTAPVLEVDQKGLKIGAHISEGAQDAWMKVKDGTYKGFSIGGRINPGGKVKANDGGFDLIDITINEISLCDRPKVPGAVYHLIKSQDGQLVDCQEEGGDKMTDEIKKTDDKGLLAQFAAWIKGEGKDETLKEMGIDLTKFAPASDVEELKKGIDEIKSGMEAMKNEFITAQQLKETGAEKKSEEKSEEKSESKNDALDEIKGMFAKFNDRLSAIEEAKGVRQSSNATGEVKVEGETKNSVWSGFVPKPRE